MAKGKRRTSDTAIKELLDAGRTQREIAKIFGVSEPYISKRTRFISTSKQDEQLPPMPVNFDDPEELREWISKLIQTGDNAIKLRALELAFRHVCTPAKTSEHRFVKLENCFLNGSVLYAEDGYAEPVKVTGECRNCNQKIEPAGGGYCESCKAKFPVKTSADIAFWNGNPCPACNIEKRGHPYCLTCERRIQASEVNNEK